MIAPTPIIELSVAYWKSRAFLAAIELGLFEAISPEGLPLEDTAKELKVPLSRLRPLAMAMVELELAEITDQGDLRPTPVANIYLNPESPASMIESMSYAREMYPLWNDLEERVKSEPPAGATPTKADTPTFLMGMHNRALMLSKAILPLIDIEPSAKTLDVAAGAGTWTWLLQKEKGLKMPTLMEQPELCSPMEEFIKGQGLDGGHFLPGDYHQLNLEETFDAVLFFGALHQDRHEDLESVLQKLWSATAPGGKLLILDIFAEVDGKDPLFPWLFGLNMMLTTVGSVFTLQEVLDAGKTLPELSESKTHSVQGDLPYALIELQRAH
jgi:3-hydroxy-5-methyl-1-naphthoate 3-O-methyltransferase